MSRSEGKTIKVKPSLHMRMEIRIQRNLPLGTSLYPCVQGRGSGISPWRRSLFQSINFPCKNFKEIFSPFQCSTEDPSLVVTHLCTRSKRRKIAWKEQALQSKAQMLYVATPSMAPSESICIQDNHHHLKLTDFPKGAVTG